jgi:hypothetical protein
MLVERGLVFPAGVNMKEALILGRAKRIDLQTAWFLSGWAQHILNRRGDKSLLTFFGIATGENEEFRCHRLFPVGVIASETRDEQY